MGTNPIDLLLPRILVVDDERQIYASIRLRLGSKYVLKYCANTRDALAAVAGRAFDLCFVDIHMPGMDGLEFIGKASKIDEALGYVILSAFGSDENLRRIIPLQVYEFLEKPLPERDGFEAKIPEWIERTRTRRQRSNLANHASHISRDLESARLEREVELVASESARDALLQTSSLLTTIHALLVSSSTLVALRARADPSLGQIYRTIEEARKTADAAVNVAETFFGSGYGNRDSSPAVVDVGLKHAAGIASRSIDDGEAKRIIDCSGVTWGYPIRGLSGIDFMLMMIPVLQGALSLSPAESTVRVTTEPLARLDAGLADLRFRSCLWFNRRQSTGTLPGVLIVVSSPGPALSEDSAEGWLRGESSLAANLTSRGLVKAVQKSNGLIGVNVQPTAKQFMLVLALPV